jgi:RimJ/RimL family protein N-acetyltransferase
VTGVALPAHLELSDDVVQLRPWSFDDVPALTEIWQDGELQRRFAVAPPVTDASTTGYVKGVTGAWRDGVQLSLAIEVDGAVVGGCDLDELDQATPQLGYWLAAGARGSGYATRAAGLLVEWARDARDASRLGLEVEPDNAASIKLAERLGFSRVDGVERRDGDRLLAVFERALSC